ncbi:MAG: glycoside hydrolase family 13 protein [Clostridia bacterium]|nr:glycoside hydrolase family 13 protein [Clostridia bacterium]
MNIGAIRHESLLPFRQPLARCKIRFRLLAACDDLAACRIVYWKRSEPEKRFEAAMQPRARDGQHEEWVAEIGFAEEAHYIKYFFRLIDRDGRRACYSEYGLTVGEPAAGYFELLQANGAEIITLPTWARGAVYYQIFPERFFRGCALPKSHDLDRWEALPTRENYLGGDLPGIRQKLVYLQKLGIDCLYLNPIFEADFNHKYATTDYFRVDPDFGSEEDLKELASEAHERGIRVILDGVFNHCGTHFAPFRDLMEKGEKSAYAHWFHPKKFPIEIHESCYECVGDYPYMPRLNTGEIQVQEYILSVMRYWIRHTGIDGWRLDVADELDTDCLRYLRRELCREYPQALLLGETWSDASRMLLGNDQCHTAMNYLFRDAMVDYFARGVIDEEALLCRLERMRMKYPDEILHGMYNCLASHDTPRFLTLAGGEKWRLRLAIAFQMLYPGSPAVYYGEEIGMEGENDPGCRAGMAWGRMDEELRQWTEDLIRFRHEHPAVCEGSLRIRCADKQKKLFAFERVLNTERVIAVFNTGDTPQDFAAEATGNVMVPARAVKIITHKKEDTP